MSEHVMIGLSESLLLEQFLGTTDVKKKQQTNRYKTNDLYLESKMIAVL